jgi:quercetin dioxygenase-like cupin family protein
MASVFNINKLDELPAFSPPHHTKTTDRKLVDETTGARNLALWHGEIEPGGVADLHVHEDMEQAFIVLEGKGRFMVEDQEHTPGEGSIIFIPAKQPHQVTSVGDRTLKVLIVMAPPPSSMEAWQKQSAD